MRIPNVGEFLAIFAATGQLSDFSKLPGADSESSLLLAAPCDPGQQYAILHQGETCDSIATSHKVPTYQIICENDQINGKCSNLQIVPPANQVCLGRPGVDCREIFTTVTPYTTAKSISDHLKIPLGVFEQNNYCVTSAGGTACPSFNPSTVVCAAKQPIGRLPPCPKVLQ